MNPSELDLKALAVDRSTEDRRSIVPPPRRWFSRYVVPLGLLLGFGTLVVLASAAQWLPRQPVTVIPVVVAKSTSQRGGSVLFQAPGWVEPRPTPIKVAALTTGIIEELLVVEGDYVEQGEPIARLVAIDAELNLAKAKNLVEIREAALEQIEAERQAAIVRLDRPLQRRAELATAHSELAKAQAVKQILPYQIAAAKAEVEFAEKSFVGKKAAQTAVAERAINQSERDLATAMATLQELLERQSSIDRELEALTAKTEALEQQLELRVEEKRQLDEANARARSARALCEEARLQLREAELILERTVIRAPVSGRILNLSAAPGSSVNEGHFGGSTVAEMYDPKKLQVRVDVRLEDVPKVSKGQPVEIRTASVSRVIQGRVLHLTSTANVQRNTLEVKVELIDPPETVSPEMLVSATFLAPATTEPSEPATRDEIILIPGQLVQAGGSGKFVWVVDDQQRAKQKIVETGAAAESGLVEIKAGLSVTDKVIVAGSETLKPGTRVLASEDRTLGVSNR